MKIKLNVRINITPDGRVFTVWPRQHKYLPSVEFYTGHGTSPRDAAENLLMHMPDEFVIEDVIAVRTTSLEYEFCRPFEVVSSDIIRTFSLA